MALKVNKLDGVGSVDNRPSTDNLNNFCQFFLKDKLFFLFFYFSYYFFVFYIFCFNVNFFSSLCDRWHVTGDTWHVTNSMGWTFSQNFSSLEFLVLNWQCIEYIWTKGSLNQWINELITSLFIEQPQLHRACLKVISNWRAVSYIMQYCRKIQNVAIYALFKAILAGGNPAIRQYWTLCNSGHVSLVMCHMCHM